MLAVEHMDLYYGAAQALKDVSVTAEAGQVTCILGRNGVGKTSLMRAISGRQGIARGRITWEGQEISNLRSDARARLGVATVPQGREIFPLLTVRENLETGFALLPRGERKVPDTVFDLFPVLGEMMNRRGGDLSGGQQQQLAIGRAMVTRPKLLLMDEPTEGIQPSIIKDIGRAIAFLRDQGHIAIVLVEQFFDFAIELASRVAVMDRGRVVLAGTPSELDEAEVRRWMSV
jgi:urea transport system ATP-binding protein